MLWQDGDILGISSMELEDVSGPVMQKPDDIMRCIKSCAKEVLGDIYSVDCIVVGGIWHSMLWLDKTCEPVGTIRTWAETAAADFSGQAKKDTALNKDFYQRTGCPIHSIYPLWQHLYWKNAMPEQYQDMSFIVTQGSYIFYKLTGEKLASKCTNAGSGFFNIHTLEYDKEILKYAGISEDNVWPLAEPFEARGLLKDVADELGIRQGTPVAIGGSDGATNQIAAGIKKGMMTFSMGTSSAVRMVPSVFALPEEPSVWGYYLAEGKRIMGGASSGGNCLGWFKKKVFSGRYTYPELEEAANASDIANAPIFLPFIYGERSPGWNETRKGGFVRLMPGHGHADMFQGVLEGILFNIRQCYDALIQICGEPETISFSGGIVRSPIWSQMAADIFGRKLDIFPHMHASLYGMAGIGLKTLGAIKTIDDFVPLASKNAVFPNPGRQRIYKERYDEYLYFYALEDR